MEYKNAILFMLLALFAVLAAQFIGSVSYAYWTFADYLSNKNYTNLYTISNVTLHMKNYTIRFIDYCPGCAGFTTGNDDIWIAANNVSMQQLYHVCLHEACHNLAPFKTDMVDPALEEHFCNVYQYDEDCMRMVFWLWQQEQKA